MAFTPFYGGFKGSRGQTFGSSVLAKASRGVPARGNRAGSYAARYNAARRTSVATPAQGGANAGALAAIQRAKAQYAPGGGFGKGVEAGLERGRVKATSMGMQSLVSSGLAGTTMAAGLGTKFEEEVAAPTRAGVEGQRAQAISGIEMQEAGMRFQAGEAGLQRGFQASQSAAQRTLQEYIANLQANLQRESTSLRNQPTTQASPQARQFPSLYGEAGGTAPSLMGGGGGGLMRPGARQYDLPEDEERFDIDFG